MTVRPARDVRFDWRVSLAIAVIIFAQEMTRSFYDAQVPPLVAGYVASVAVVGLVMGMDNILGLLLPWMGSMSDNARTRWGRRVPFIVIATPVAAMLFILIPHATNFWVLLALLMAYALLMNLAGLVSQALIPDFIPDQHRSRTNAVVRIVTTLTMILTALISLLLIDQYPRASFVLPALIMVAATFAVVGKIRDDRSVGYQEAVGAQVLRAGDSPTRVRDVLKYIVSSDRGGQLLLLVGIMLFAGVWSAMRSLLTNYGMFELGLTRGEAGALGLPGAVVFVVVALPVALLSERIGRMRSIFVGVGLFVVGMAVGVLMPTVAGAVLASCLATIGYTGFTINAVVILWSVALEGSVGTYTGIYAISSSLGAAVVPALVGAFVDVTAWRWLFLGASLVGISALAVLALASRRISEIPERPERIIAAPSVGDREG